jgi:hypothetical protein
VERAYLVARIVDRSSLDDEVKRNALAEVDAFKSGFALSPLSNPWNHAGQGMTIMKDHGRPIQYLSQTVRAEVSYPRLAPEEVAELVELIDAYLAELADEDVPEFVRQSIRDGLHRFKFQLQKIGWMGSGYLLEAFREVMFAYDEVNRHATSPDLNASAALKGLWLILTKFKTTVETAKGWADAGNTVWKVYKVGSAVATPFLLTWMHQNGSNG